MSTPGRVADESESSREGGPIRRDDQQLVSPIRAINTPIAMLRHLQSNAGNRAVSRFLAQRSARSDPATVQLSGEPEQEVGVEGGPLRPEVAERIQARRGGGGSLDHETRGQMEHSFGASFGDVSVHTDGESDTLNRKVGAVAFTTGSDIFFREGAYQPGTPGGNQLLAHELTHVVQQRGASGGGPMTVGAADDSYEQEADAVAHAMQHAQTAVSVGGSAPLARTIMRDADDDTRADLDAAGQKAAQAEAPPPAVAQMSNVSDVSSAQKTLAEVQAATPTLVTAMGKPGWGEGVKPEHQAANTAMEQSLQEYLTYAGEESRTTSDFQNRYMKASQQFAKLDGMAKEYAAKSGTDAGDASALIESQTGGSAAAAGTKLGKLAKGAAGAAVSASQREVKRLQMELTKAKNDLNSADRDIISNKKATFEAAEKIAKAAEDAKSAPNPPDSAAVAQVNAEMTKVKGYCSKGISMAVKAAPIPGGDKAAAGVEAVADLASDALIEQIYQEELDRATAVQNSARTASSAMGKAIDTAELERASNDWKKAVDTQVSNAKLLDQMQQALHDEIRKLGDEADAATDAAGGKDHKGGGGYAILAQFLSEADVYLQEVDEAISMGSIQQDTGEEAGQKETAVTHRGGAGSDGQVANSFYSAEKVGEKYEVIPHHVTMATAGTGTAHGKSDMNKTAAQMIEGLKHDRDTVKTYQTELNKVFNL